MDRSNSANPFDAMLDALENRAEQRKKTAIHAFASDIDHKYEIKCIIREISQSGCRIVSNELDDLPEMIHLLPENFDRPVLGRVVWRDKSIAGVQFLSDMEGEGLLINPVGEQSRQGPSSILGGEATQQPPPKIKFSDRFRFFSRRKDKSARKPAKPGQENSKSPASSMISMVVHEFRTPLTSILGSLGLIRNSLGGLVPDKIASLFSIAERNAEKLKLMVNDLLDLDKAGAGKLILESRPLEIVALARDAISVNEPYAKKYGVYFRLDDRVGEAHICADPDRLEQVLTNLLSNSAKFSPKGTAIDVIVERRDGPVRISVRDRGPGIAPDQQAEIFKQFTQLQSSQGREKHGTGLGLSICKLIVEQHGSRLQLASEPGKGSTFFFEFPELEGKSGDVSRTGTSA